MPNFLRVSYNHNPAFVIENVETQGFVSFIDAVNSMVDIPVMDVVNVHNIIQAQSSIARESRRGLGNVICTNDAHGAFGEWGRIHGEKVTMIASEEFDGTYLMYQGPKPVVPDVKPFDGTVLNIDDVYYVHPDYKKYARKLNLV